MVRLRVLGLLAMVLLVAHGCTDGDGLLDPEGESSAAIELSVHHGDAVGTAGSQQIDSVRVTMLNLEADTLLADTTAAVPADSIRVDLTFPGATLPTVTVTAELLEVLEGSGSTVAWSSRADSVPLEAETRLEMPPLGRGPLENLAVEEVTIVAPSGLSVVEGQTLQLGADVTLSDPDVTPTLFWTSLAPDVATVDDQGLVTALVHGTTSIRVAAGHAADTVEVTVQPAGDVPVNPPPLWIADFGQPLEQFDDDCDFVEFGFTFTFYGQDYTGVWVNSNGNMTFGSCNTNFSDADVPDGSRVLVAPLYGDWDPGDGGDVHWNVVGSAPNRTFVVTWLTVPEFSNEDGPGTSTFQAQLREGSNTIVFGYNTLTTDGINWTTSSSGEADMEVGISSGTGSFIRSAVGAEIPALQATNICYTSSGADHSEVDCGQLGAAAASALTSGGPAPLGRVTPGVEVDPPTDRYRLEKLRRGGHRR